MVNPAYTGIDARLWHHPARPGITETCLCLWHSSDHRGAEILAALDELETASPSRLRLTFSGAPWG